MKLSYNVTLIFQDNITITGQALELAPAESGIYRGGSPDLAVELLTGSEIRLAVENRSGKPIASIRWHLTCQGENIAKCRVPLACTTQHSGVVALKGQTPASSMLTGLFYGADKPCLFLGSRLPQNNIHNYQVTALNDDTVEITGTTEFTVGQGAMEQLTGETAILVLDQTPLQAMQTYADHLPELTNLAEPMVGWNSWDYYFNTVSAEDVKENLAFIQADPRLKAALKTAVVDDGWETCVGEWYANHRFPAGLTALAEMIRSYGLTPGIWTNGAQTESLSVPGLRHPEYFIPDEFGIPLTADGRNIIDPTHPATEAFIMDTYTRLYQAGFRVFKVDFISTILQGKRFYDPACGPYEAVRRLIRLIRKAVGPDSHIVGCSFPAECGPGLVESSRISVDIHNHWLHVIWIMEFMQARFWQNGKLFRSDPDMLLVRGSDTSLEAETNVFNPWNLVPPGEGRFASRWRRGPVFNYDEAETWANLVVFSGGDIMLGDRLSKLNAKGLALVYSHLAPHSCAAVPLDLGDSEVAELWYDKDTNSLLAVNTQDTQRELTVDFARYGLTPPQTLTCDKSHTYENGILTISLNLHQSAVITM